jgi:DNA polymerase
VPLKRGHFAYFEAPDAQIMVAPGRWTTARCKVEDLTEVQRDGSVEVYMPSDELLGLIDTADEIVFHNSAFDRRRSQAAGASTSPCERIHDTMVQAMAHSLPGSLGKLGEIMGWTRTRQKDEEGQKADPALLHARPQEREAAAGDQGDAPRGVEAVPALRRGDIPPMRALRKQAADVELPRHAERSCGGWTSASTTAGSGSTWTWPRRPSHDQARAEALASRGQADDGRGGEGHQRDDLLNHIFVEYGIYLPDLKKDTLERRLDDPEIPDALKQLLRVRLATSTTSTAKYNAVRSVSSGRHLRLRGTTAFCGALSTGRWAGRIFQPQNLPRPDMKPAR